MQVQVIKLEDQQLAIDNSIEYISEHKILLSSNMIENYN